LLHSRDHPGRVPVATIASFPKVSVYVVVVVVVVVVDDDHHPKGQEESNRRKRRRCVSRGPAARAAIRFLIVQSNWLRLESFQTIQ